MFPVGQNTGDEPHQEEIQNLGRFNANVAPRPGPLVETQQDVRSVA